MVWSRRAALCPCVLAALLLSAHEAWAQPELVSPGDEPGMSATPPPSSQPASSQPASNQPASSLPASRFLPPPPPPPPPPQPGLRPGLLTSQQPPRVRLQTSVNSALHSGKRAGTGLAFVFAAPALLNVTTVFGKYTSDLADRAGDDYGGLAVMGMFFTVPVTVGSAVLAGLGIYSGGSRMSSITAKLYEHELAKRAFGAGYLKGLGSGLLLVGGIGVGFYGIPLIMALAYDETGSGIGWDDWTWPAWLAGLSYCGSLLITGAIIYGVGSSRATTILERVRVAPMPLRDGRGAGLTLGLVL